MEIERADGRKQNQLRPLACSRGILNRAHGSSNWSQGIHTYISLYIEFTLLCIFYGLLIFRVMVFLFSQVSTFSTCVLYKERLTLFYFYSFVMIFYSNTNYKLYLRYITRVELISTPIKIDNCIIVYKLNKFNKFII